MGQNPFAPGKHDHYCEALASSQSFSDYLRTE